jgi:glycine cleavage system H protein
MARERFQGRFPQDLLYDIRADVWVRRSGDELTIGATSYGAHFAGEILAFTPKRVGAEVEAERSIGVVEVAKTMVAIHAPLSLRIAAVNEQALQRPALINDDPYGAGWLVRAAPLRWQDEKARLVGRDAYVAHVLAAEPDAEIAP